MRFPANDVIRLANIRESAVAAQIHALQQAAYLVEAERIGCAEFPPLRETIQVLQSSTDCFLVFLDHDNIVGCLSYESVGTNATITRLVVSPQHFRRAIATALLRALDGRLPVGGAVYASTADSNEPAIRAYEKHGYRTVSRKVSPEGIALHQLQKLVVLLIAASLLSGCASTVCMPSKRYLTRVQRESQPVYVTNPELRREYERLQTSGVYLLSGDPVRARSLTLQPLRHYGSCANPLMLSAVTFGIVPGAARQLLV